MLYGGSGDRRAKAEAALQAVGMGQRMHHKPNELSGGQQQRVAIARAIVTRPALLVADEPTGNLDTATGATVADLLLQLHRSRGMTLIIVTHDTSLIARCGRRIRLVDGSVAEDVRDSGAMAA
jgi:putative ABC transport system ATP-binding protein